MQKQESVSARDLRPSIHLSGAASIARDNECARIDKLGGAITASAVNDYDLKFALLILHAVETCPDVVGFV